MWQEKNQLLQLLLSNHDVFALTEGDRGETDLLQIHTDTSNSLPRYQPACRTPFAIHEEITRQLNQMQQQGVISPSSSSWASPVVLVDLYVFVLTLDILILLLNPMCSHFLG